MQAHAVLEPLSPELVLVSPDLRELAFQQEARLGIEREYAMPPTARLVVSGADVPPAELRITVGATTMLAAAALLLFGAGLAVGSFTFGSSATPPPVAESAPASRPATSAAVGSPSPENTRNTPHGVQTRLSLAPASRVRSLPPQRPATGSAPVRPVQPLGPPTTIAAHPVPAKTRGQLGPTLILPVAGGGYVFPTGRFRLSADGRTLLEFTLDTSCAGTLTLPAIHLGRTATFAFTGKVQGATIRLEGRFASPREARGTLQLANLCKASLPFVARLS